MCPGLLDHYSELMKESVMFEGMEIDAVWKRKEGQSGDRYRVCAQSVSVEPDGEVKSTVRFLVNGQQVEFTEQWVSAHMERVTQ